MPDFMCYATLAMLRQKEGVASTNTTDDPRRMAKLRDASKAIESHCGGRVFQPYQETRTFDWTSNEHMDFRSYDLLTLSSLTDGTGNVKQTAALIMQGNRFSDATKYGPWYAVRVDTTKDFLLYNITPFRCMQVNGTWGYHDDYGIAGANAFVPVYTDATLGTALTATVADGATRTITLSSDPTQSYDGYFQAWQLTDGTLQGAISPGSLIQVENEWMQVFSAVGGANTLVVQRGANGTTATAHTAKAVSVYQPIADVREACYRYANFLLRQDDAPFGKTLMPAMGQVIVPYKLPPDVCELLEPYVKRRVA